MESDSSQEARIQQLEQRGRKRMTRYYLGGVAVAVVIGLGVATAAGTHGHARHHNVGAIIAGVVIGVLGMILVLWLGRRRWANTRDLSLSAGLNRDQRKQVARDIREGTPSNDPVLLEAERRQVRQLLAQRRWGPVLFPVLGLVQAANAALPDRSPTARILFGAAAVLFFTASPFYLRAMNRARRFPMATAGLSKPGSGSTGDGLRSSSD